MCFPPLSTIKLFPACDHSCIYANSADKPYFFEKCWHIVETGYCQFGEIFVAGCPEIYQNVVCPDGLSSPGARISASRLMSVIIPFIYGRALEGRERVCIHEFHPAQYSCCFYHILLFRDYVFGIPPPVRDIIVNHNPIASIKGAAMTFGFICTHKLRKIEWNRLLSIKYRYFHFIEVYHL